MRRPNQRRKQVRFAQVELSDDGTDVEQVALLQSSRIRKTPYVQLCIDNVTVTMMVDTGASVNIIDADTYRGVGAPWLLIPTKVKIFLYGGQSPLPVMGKFSALVGDSQTGTTKATFYVVPGSGGSLLGFPTTKSLSLIHGVHTLGQHSTSARLKDMIRRQFPCVCSGVGRLKSRRIRIHIDPTVPPVAQHYRRVPFHLRAAVEAELRRLLCLDLIEPVRGPTPWVSPITVVPKPKSSKEIRLCVDMGHANRAILRERHVMPTLDDAIYATQGATIFNGLDLKNAYHQLELDEESKGITTFSTHIGLFRFKQLNFGVSSAAEVFQDTIRQVISGIPGALNISDNILVYGCNRKAHDCALKAVLQRLDDEGLTLNLSKCEFAKSEIEFFGHIFTPRGIKPDPAKVDAIGKLKDPTNVAELRSFLGMVTYCGRFIPNLADRTVNLRQLLKEETPWLWTAEHHRDMHGIQEVLVKKTELTSFNVRRRSHLFVDASPVGLGTILCQLGKFDKTSQVVAYASRALTPVEQRYSQIQTELLAIRWATQHFHVFLFGQKFVLHTDHQPLVSILKNPASRPSARMERWLLFLQHYVMDIEYTRGTSNPSDYLSRYGTLTCPSKEEKTTEHYINFLTSVPIHQALTMEELASATAEDTQLQAIITALDTGRWPKDAYTHKFQMIQDELSLSNKRNSSPKPAIGCPRSSPGSHHHPCP